jgi:hypothetical protein
MVTAPWERDAAVVTPGRVRVRRRLPYTSGGSSPISAARSSARRIGSSGSPSSSRLAWKTPESTTPATPLRPSSSNRASASALYRRSSATRVTTTERYAHVSTPLMRDAGERLASALWKTVAIATSTATMTPRKIKRPSSQDRDEGLSPAEDRGFEPRMVLPPNRISSSGLSRSKPSYVDRCGWTVLAERDGTAENCNPNCNP